MVRANSVQTRFQSFAAVVVLALISIGGLAPVHAQNTPTSAECTSYVPPEEKSDPHMLALRGVACFESKNFIQALVLYREAYAISKSAPLRGAIGRTLQELGYPELARDYFTAYLSVQTDDTEGYQKIRQRLSVVDQTLKNRATETVIESNPGGAKVFAVLEGEYWEELGTTPLKIRLLPGDYRLVFRRADFITRVETVTVPKSKKPVRLQTRMVPQDSLFDTTGAQWRRYGVYTMITSVPFVVAGGTLLILSNQRFQESDEYLGDLKRKNQLNDEAYNLQTWGIVSSAVGGSVLVTGLVFYVIGANSGDDDQETSIWVTPNSVGVRTTW